MNRTKKFQKKYIYIGIGLVVFILIAVGAFFLWKKLKNSNKSDSADEEDKDINPEEIPTEIKEYRKKDWVDHKSGLSSYEIPNLPTNISASRAKDELLEALWQWTGKRWDKKKIERTLVKNAQRINLADKKENKGHDPLFNSKFLERLAEKYQQDIFFNRPNQDKFEKEIKETRLSFYFLFANFKLKYKSNKKIDWLASLREFTDSKKDNKTKTQKEEDFEKVISYMEREIKPFVVAHTNKFTSLTSLKELNQWANTLARKNAAASRLAVENWYRAQEIDKKVLSPATEGKTTLRYVNIKNEKFDLFPVVTIYNMKEEK